MTAHERARAGGRPASPHSHKVESDTDALRRIAQLAQQRADLDAELTTAVSTARAHHRSWSEIGTTTTAWPRVRHRADDPGSEQQ